MSSKSPGARTVPTHSRHADFVRGKRKELADLKSHLEILRKEKSHLEILRKEKTKLSADLAQKSHEKTLSIVAAKKAVGQKEEFLEHTTRHVIVIQSANALLERQLKRLEECLRMETEGQDRSPTESPEEPLDNREIVELDKRIAEISRRAISKRKEVQDDAVRINQLETSVSGNQKR